VGSLPSWLSGRGRLRAQNARSGAHERQLARQVGGRTQPGSGSSWRARGDVKNDELLIEHKYTGRANYLFDVRQWIKHVERAREQGRVPAMVIDFDEYKVSIVVTTNA